MDIELAILLLVIIVIAHNKKHCQLSSYDCKALIFMEGNHCA